jgi:hypothetical protein
LTDKESSLEWDSSCEYSDLAETANINHLTHYVLVRADLPRGIQSANLVHAAGESSPGELPEGTFAVVLAVANEHALSVLADQLETAAIAHVKIREPDAPYCGALMAIGIVPVADRKEVRRIVSSLPLLR